MNEHAPAIFVALEGSAFAAGIRSSTWAYMAANVGHILFLFLFACSIAVMDLRMSGALAATTPGFVIGRARKFAMAAFGGMIVTGFILFSAEASHVALNPVFQIKVCLIVLGLLNVLWFQFAIEPRIRDLPPLVPLPSSARTAGIASITIWLLVAACGRSIAYF
jgi:hypothetical protein